MRARAKAFGPRYAIAHAVLRTALRVEQRAQDTLLEIEGERGVLGPAHRDWTDNSAEANRRRWNEWDSATGWITSRASYPEDSSSAWQSRARWPRSPG